MTRGVDLAAIHPAVEAGVNNQDLDGLMALYAPDASMVVLDGSTVTGLVPCQATFARLTIWPRRWSRAWRFRQVM
jgi:ketosteroid isomerase-like protein